MLEWSNEKNRADKTPHEARHTFETNLDNSGGNRRCIDLLMGHKSKDIGNRVYNHKTFTQLKDTINLLKLVTKIAGNAVKSSISGYSKSVYP